MPDEPHTSENGVIDGFWAPLELQRIHPAPFKKVGPEAAMARQCMREMEGRRIIRQITQPIANGW